MGGLARKATIINQAQLNDINTILVDTGDLFFATNKISANEPMKIDEFKIRADIIVNSYNAMNYNVFSPGEKDFALGKLFLKKLESKSNFDYISCNLYDKESERRLFDEYKIEDLNGFKIGYIGAVSSFNGDSILVKEPLSEIKKTVNKISNKVQYLVLLFNGSESDLSRLQKSEIAGIDIILRSKGSSRASDNGGKDRIPVLSAGTKGKYINKIEVEINNINDQFVDIKLEGRAVKVSEDRLEKKKKGDPEANLDELYKDNQKILNDISYHRRKISKAKQKLNNATNTFNCEKIALNKEVDSKAEILLIVDEGMIKIPKGPDFKGRPVGHPHHGHNH